MPTNRVFLLKYLIGALAGSVPLVVLACNRYPSTPKDVVISFVNATQSEDNDAKSYLSSSLKNGLSLKGLKYTFGESEVQQSVPQADEKYAVVPPAPAESSTTTHCHRERPATHRSVYRPYAELMRRTFQIDVERCECGGRFKLRALVIEAHNIERLLRYLGEPLEPPKPSPARDPPYFKTLVLRRRLGELN